jgi:superfamily II DNA/RNA helicase
MRCTTHPPPAAQIKPNVEHVWVPTARYAGQQQQPQEDSSSSGRLPRASQALLDAVTSDPDYQAGRARTLVFCSNSASADRVSKLLREQGVPHHVYHKSRPAADNAAALAAMAGRSDDAAASGSSSSSSSSSSSQADTTTSSSSSSASSNRIMVSTDAAARGIDLPDVTHVIQADFAANAIEFLHRVGRTARAGRSGKVTSLYGKADAVLAEALQQYVREGRPVEECFSRNRSFRSKVKKYGQFVPRGQAGGAVGSASE